MVTRRNPIFDTATTLGKILGFLGVSAICGVLVAGLLVPAAAVSGSAASGSIEFFDTLPAELKVDPPSQSAKILAADGSLIANLYEENRTKVSLDQISPFMKEAVIAVEDSRFYDHGGVDTTGILRALVSPRPDPPPVTTARSPPRPNPAIIRASPRPSRRRHPGRDGR